MSQVPPEPATTSSIHIYFYKDHTSISKTYAYISSQIIKPQHMQKMGYLVFAISSLALTFLISKLWLLFKVLFWRPYVFTKCFEKQGITGPPYTLLSGSLPEMKKLKKAARDVILDTNSNDITQRIVPHYHNWSSLYGETFVYWYGIQPRIHICDAELAKHVLSNKFGFYPKPRTRPSIEILIGKLGLVLVNGLDWVKHRRTLTPAFSTDKIKVMIKRMAACSIHMLDEWKNQQDGQCCKKINAGEEFMTLTSDIIAHTAFGSSYARGKEAFNAQKELQHHSSTAGSDVFIPGTQYLPTPSNLEIWRLHRNMTNSIRRVIESRVSEWAGRVGGRSDHPWGDDLLGLLIGASQSSHSFSMDEILDECKTFFFAGHETTSNLLTWTVFLLSLHQEWQERLREEVLKECGMRVPDADMIAKLKLVNMVLLEVLRLYGPVIELIREASEDMKLGKMMIPKGTQIVIPLVTIHRNKDYWGEDANKFNPLRFMNGVSKAANHPNAFLPFSMGPRSCIGQNFAMLEAKTVIVLILQRFSMSLSSEYRHAPVENLTIQPQFGLPVLLKPVTPRLI